MNKIAPLVVVGVVSVVWEIVFNIGLFDPILFPSLAAVIKAFAKLVADKSFWIDVGSTLGRMSVGYILAAAIGISSGIAIGYFRILFAFASPVIDFFRSTPVTVLYPFFVLFFGIGSISKIAMVFVASVFIITLNTAYGVQACSPSRVASGILFGGTKYQVMRKIILWESLPQILIGCRTALSLSLIVSILVEMFMGSENGIGQRVMDSYTSFRIPALYALVFVTGTIGFMLNVLFVRFERKIAHWHWYDPHNN